MQNRSRVGPHTVFESTGAQGKLRGTAHQLVEKYVTLARDARVAGNDVMAENCFQYAEHYRRLVSGFQERRQMTSHTSAATISKEKDVEAVTQESEFLRNARCEENNSDINCTAENSQTGHENVSANDVKRETAVISRTKNTVRTPRVKSRATALSKKSVHVPDDTQNIINVEDEN